MAPSWRGAMGEVLGGVPTRMCADTKDWKTREASSHDGICSLMCGDEARIERSPATQRRPRPEARRCERSLRLARSDDGPGPAPTLSHVSGWTQRQQQPHWQGKQ